MSETEENAAILRLVKHRSEAKRRKALLESDLRIAGQSLSGIGDMLRHLNGGPYDDVGRILPEVEKAPDICGLGHVKSMLAELKDLQESVSQMNRSASALGVD